MMKKNGINDFTVLIVDDHEIIRRALKDLITSFWPGVKIIVATTIKQALLMQAQLPRLIIMDINLPGVNTITTIAQIQSVYPDTKIMVFSSLNEEIYAIPIIKSGVSGFVSKQASESEIVTAITAILAGTRYVRPNVRESVLSKMFENDVEHPFTILSGRELEIAGLLRLGIGILEISKQLNLKAGTVSTYKIRIFHKLKINDVIALAAKMDANDLLLLNSTGRS